MLDRLRYTWSNTSQTEQQRKQKERTVSKGQLLTTFVVTGGLFALIGLPIERYLTLKEIKQVFRV